MATAVTTIKSTSGKAGKHNASTVERDIRRQIAAGSLAKSTPLPSLRDLSREYGVAVNTISRAIKVLVEEGALRSEGIRGVYVADTGGGDLTLTTAQVFPRPVSIAIVARLDRPVSQREMRNSNWAWLGVHSIEQALQGQEDVTLRYHNQYVDLNTDVPIENILRDMAEQNPDAIVAVMPSVSAIDALAQFADGRGIPLALMTDLDYNQPGVTVISFDDTLGAFEATKHLMRRGYDRIGFFGPLRSFWADHRVAGVRTAVKSIGGPDERVTAIEPGDYPVGNNGGLSQEDFAYKLAPLFLDQMPTGCGIVAVNDHCAVGLVRAARDRGLVLGRDYGLVGFDDIDDARDYDLSTMRPPISEMALEAVRVLAAAINRANAPDKVVLRAHLVPRQSTVREGVRHLDLAAR
ncbi:MAG TPA: LacI family DNA-binding transcriptional regulator [Capsulimonadaceae bacterium]